MLPFPAGSEKNKLEFTWEKNLSESEVCLQPLCLPDRVGVCITHSGKEERQNTGKNVF